MKKIIYSLVIMIAAGSLFTSCIQPIEPAGIYDLREAKARYYDALSKLRAADALYREAQADHEKAMAEYQRAKTENQQLQNYYQQLVNEAKELDNEKEAEKWALELEQLLAQREKDRITWETELAQAIEAQRQALSAIEMAALDLTNAEKTALNGALTLYNNALAAYQTAEKEVLDAEALLWDAQYDYENQKLNGINTGLDLVEYYEALVEYNETMAALYALYYAEFAADSDAATWSEDLTALKEEIDAEKYARHQVTVDSVLFMEGVFHEANTQFKLETEKWIEENEGVKEPAAPGAEPTKAQYPASNYYTDSIEFPVFEIKAGPAYDKFVSLLIGPAFNENYAAVKSLVTDTTSMIIVKDGSKLTLNAVYEMKDFVLGSETPTTDSLEFTYYDKETKKDKKVAAKWGLEGALSVLKRDKVLADETGKTQEEKEKEAEDALKLWNADRDSILLLYAAKKADKSVAEAYEPLKDAMDDLADAKDDAASDAGSLVKAAEKIITTLNGIITHDDCSTADSTAMVNAFVEFAQKREAYLEYTPYKTDPAVKFDNKDLFYFAKASSPVIVDSVAFTDLKLEDFQGDTRYQYQASDGTKKGTTKVEAFYQVAVQLLGAEIADAIYAMSSTNPEITDLDVALNDYDGASYHYTAFYGDYKYDNSAAPAKITKKNGDPYTPKEVSDAITAVKNEVDNLNTLWDRFWKEDLGATADADGKVTIPVLDDKYNPACYTLSTFTSPYNVVIFDGNDIVWTEAIGDILGSVDPNKDDSQGTTFKDGTNVRKTGAKKAAIFYGTNGNTDFYDYLYKLNQTKAPSTTALQEIEKWINDVKEAFAKEQTSAETKATNAYNTAHATWEGKKKTYDEKLPAYKAYIEKLKAFVGTDEDGNLINVTTNGEGIKVPSLTAIDAPVDYEATQVKQTLVAPNTYEAEWDADKIGGEQKAIADKLFVDKDGNTYPELLAAWRTEAETRKDKIGHMETIATVTEDALLAALAVLDPETAAAIATDPEYTNNVEGFFEYALDAIEAKMNSFLQAATIAEKQLEKAKAGYDATQINIFGLEQALIYKQAILEEAKAKLAAAEEYYNTVIAHIFGEN